MVSVWQEKQRVWRIVAKTHHLKTLYIMVEVMEIEAAVSEADLIKIADEDVIDRLLTDMGALFLSEKEPVLLSSAAISGSDIRYQ